MWIILAIVSSLGLGVYDIFKKLSVSGNNVLAVLFCSTACSALLLSPVVIATVCGGSVGFGGDAMGHAYIALKALIVLASWVMGFYAVKYLPLTITGPVNATRPVLVLVGAILVFGERLNALQWAGVALGFCSLFFAGRMGAKEGFSLRHSRWLWLIMGATVMGAVSALYDKFLIRRYEPLQVQAWFSLYQAVIMGAAIVVMHRLSATRTPFVWRWTIPCIALFLTAADVAYFFSLSQPGAMVSVVSMIRRGSVLVSFCFGVVALREKNVRLKLVDLAVLLLGLALLVLGSR